MGSRRCDDGCTRSAGRRHRQCPPPKRATPPFDATARTDERRHGPCRDSAPQRTAPEEGKGPGGGTRGAQHGRVPDDSSSSRAGALRPLRGAPREAVQLAVGTAGAAVGVQRHTVLHIVDILPYVQILDVPVPQLGRSWWNSCRSTTL